MFAHNISIGLLFLITSGCGSESIGSNGDFDCECVPYYLCDENNVIKTGGEGVIDIRIENADSKCTEELQVCCKLPKESGQSTTIAPEIPVGRGTRNECGVRHPGGIDGNVDVSSLTRIVSDESTTYFGEFPWMVAILREESVNAVFVCGGSIISPSIVLTAAHCVRNIDIKTLKVRAGDWDFQSKSEFLPHQERLVNRIEIIPGFHTTALHNDISLLILDSPFILDSHINTICLPMDVSVINTSSCIATGWGRDAFGSEGKYQPVLKKVELSLMTLDECQSKLRRTRLGRFFRLDKSFICAGGETGKDTCRGDGGGPLVCSRIDQPTTYIQVGVVSWGIGCGESSIPAVYGSVIYAFNWINEKLDVFLSNITN